MTATDKNFLTTSSKSTKVIGSVALAAGALTLIFGLIVAPPHIEQGQSARLLFVHVPSVIATYLSYFITLVGSAIYLRKKSLFWDRVAGASAEVGSVFCAVLLFSGSVWGRPTWGTFWVWDPRLTSTAVMFVSYLGYLAIRRMDMEPAARRRRSAIVGILAFVNVIIVHFSVDWWRGLHQSRTFEPSDVQIEGWYLLSFFFGTVFFVSTQAWLLIHRFRLSHLESQANAAKLDQLIDLRQSGDLGSAQTREKVV